MGTLEFTILVSLVSLFAGFLGSLTGMGGGMVIIPVLTLLKERDFVYVVITLIVLATLVFSVYGDHL